MRVKKEFILNIKRKHTIDMPDEKKCIYIDSIILTLVPIIVFFLF